MEKLLMNQARLGSITIDVLGESGNPQMPMALSIGGDLQALYNAETQKYVIPCTMGELGNLTQLINISKQANILGSRP